MIRPIAVRLLTVILAVLSVSSAGLAGPPRVVLISGEYEYSSMLTLSALGDELHRQLGFDCTYLQRTAGEEIPGLEAIDHADLVIGMIRRMTLPPEQLQRFRRYLDTGRPLVGLRTMCHAFQNWPEFDPEVLGGNYHGHYELGPEVWARVRPAARGDPLLAGVPDRFLTHGQLYKTLPLAPDTDLLLQGTGPVLDEGPEAVAWTRRYHGARIFFTTLGDPLDFQEPAFLQLLENGIFWALDRPAPSPAVALAPLVEFPVRALDAGEFVQLAGTGSFTIVDLRSPAEFAAGHVKSAVNLDPTASDFSSRLAALDPRHFYAVYGGRSAEVAAEWHRRGFILVYSFAGGFADWQAASQRIKPASSSRSRKPKNGPP